MSEREKLIELMTTQFRELINDGDWTLGEMIPNIADYLLKNGVIVPPVKIGDTVYQTDTAGRIYASTVKNIIYDTSSITFDERAIGTTVFLTKEEAEKALKGGAE